jgi:hypothetical protein
MKTFNFCQLQTQIGCFIFVLDRLSKIQHLLLIPHTCICKNDYIEIISKTIILILFGVLLVGRAHSTLVLSDI